MVAMMRCLSSSISLRTRPQLHLNQRVQVRRPVVRTNLQVVAAAATQTDVPVVSAGGESLQGTSRKRNEDRYDIQVNEDLGEVGSPFAYIGVFDGHGGYAVSEWLQDNFLDYAGEFWTDDTGMAQSAITQAFLEADKKLLQPKGGFLGSMGERGVGGSKCGSTAAVALLYTAPGGTMQLMAANVGDARVLLARDGKAVQLTEDHVPDMFPSSPHSPGREKERMRIERTNPNPRMPLVRYVGGTWRTGGILALSRAFGDAYLKGSLQFEGVRAGGDGYSSGFGVIAEPYITVTDLNANDTWVVVASDGLFENEVRGGGGGLSNQQVVDMCLRASPNAEAEEVAAQLAEAAQDAGSTDDVTVVCLRLKVDK